MHFLFTYATATVPVLQSDAYEVSIYGNTLFQFFPRQARAKFFDDNLEKLFYQKMFQSVFILNPNTPKYVCLM